MKKSYTTHFLWLFLPILGSWVQKWKPFFSSMTSLPYAGPWLANIVCPLIDDLPIYFERKFNGEFKYRLHFISWWRHHPIKASYWSKLKVLESKTYRNIYVEFENRLCFTCHLSDQYDAVMGWWHHQAMKWGLYLN